MEARRPLRSKKLPVNTGRPKQVSERMKRVVKRDVQKNRRSSTQELAEASEFPSMLSKHFLKILATQKHSTKETNDICDKQSEKIGVGKEIC